MGCFVTAKHQALRNNRFFHSPRHSFRQKYFSKQCKLRRIRKIKNTHFDKRIKKIVRNNIKENIFNYGQILENATEIHIMESSIRQILEVLNIKTKKLFLYKGRGGEHDIELYNKKLNKFVGTRIKWKVIRDCIFKKNKINNKINNKIKYLSSRVNQKIIYYRSIQKFS